MIYDKIKIIIILYYNFFFFFFEKKKNFKKKIFIHDFELIYLKNKDYLV